MIAMLANLAAGDAIRLLLNPPSTATKWRILRNETGVFASASDGVIYEGDERTVLDDVALLNGTLFYYKPIYWNGTVWDMSFAVKSITPTASFVDRSADPLMIVRTRLDYGLQAAVAKNLLSHPRGLIPVLTASPQIEDAMFPMVTVHLASDSAQDRALGEEFGEDVFIDGDWECGEGYLSRISLDVVGWSLNGDERNTLRQVIKSVLIANLPVFNAHQLYEVDIQMSDTEDFVSYQAPMYMVKGTLNCMAPSLVTGLAPDVVDVQTTVTPYF